jgi:hypothetical protein
MEWVVIMLLVSALGQPVATAVAPIPYATQELCEADRPAVIAGVQRDIDKTRPGDKVFAKCIIKDELDKALHKVPNPPLEGQKDASRLHPIY